MERIDDYELYELDFEAFIAKGLAELEADDTGGQSLSGEVLRD